MPPGALINPNAGTEWADPDPLVSTRNLIAKRIVDGDPNRFTDWANPGTPKEDPMRSDAQRDSENQDYQCKVCCLMLHSMTEFNKHCELDPRGSGREMKCEVDIRRAHGIAAPPLWSAASAEDKPVVPGAALPQGVLNPQVLAAAVAEALAPTLNTIAEVMAQMAAVLAGKKPPTKKNVGKKHGSAGSVPGAPRGRGRAPLRRLEQSPEPLVDPSKEPEAPATA